MVKIKRAAVICVCMLLFTLCSCSSFDENDFSSVEGVWKFSKGSWEQFGGYQSPDILNEGILTRNDAITLRVNADGSFTLNSRRESRLSIDPFGPKITGTWQSLNPKDLNKDADCDFLGDCSITEKDSELYIYMMLEKQKITVYAQFRRGDFSEYFTITFKKA